MIFLFEDVWDEIPIPEEAKPIQGGVLLGLLGLVSYQFHRVPRVLRVGYDTINAALFSGLTMQMAFRLVFL